MQRAFGGFAMRLSRRYAGFINSETDIMHKVQNSHDLDAGEK